METGFLYILTAIFSFWIINGMFRIFLPNYALSKYVAGEWDIPRDNVVRFFGVLSLVLGTYLLLYVWGYVSI
ncbi:MAG: hypothetical protein GWN01_07020 [Nitrosopumilaceae archaeon]|nr:hypothetical protein [Nitrosopumilaceae archaeon]NIU86137.1 hypothetical protein [Nitrosopumilaceae archaeon]NIX61285.1 hypothetical protein [Nitrosopumilaceae archaeon]